MNCYIKIEFQCETDNNCVVKIVGSIDELGKWNAE